jgi:hypothetical protein
MRIKLNKLRHIAKRFNFEPPHATPKDVLMAWVAQNGKCIWTNEPIALLGIGTDLSHNHRTGEFHGFVLHYANVAEGMLRRLTPGGRVNFIERVFPETAKLIRSKSTKRRKHHVCS